MLAQIDEYSLFLISTLDVSLESAIAEAVDDARRFGYPVRIDLAQQAFAGLAVISDGNATWHERLASWASRHGLELPVGADLEWFEAGDTLFFHAMTGFDPAFERTRTRHATHITARTDGTSWIVFDGIRTKLPITTDTHRVAA